VQLDPVSLSPAALARIERCGLDFLAEIYAIAARHRPENLEALAELASVLTRLGRHAEGLAIDRRLARLAPEDPTVQYNLACSLALTGDSDGALAVLERAIALGYADAEFLEADTDLASLRTEPRFAEILRRLRGAV
jgi:adenylate cyclase